MCITGSLNPMIKTLIPEIIGIEQLGRKNIVLHDRDPNFFDSEFIHDIVEDALNMITDITVCEMIRDALPFCDLLIIIQDLSRLKRKIPSKFAKDTIYLFTENQMKR